MTNSGGDPLFQPNVDWSDLAAQIAGGAAVGAAVAGPPGALVGAASPAAVALFKVVLAELEAFRNASWSTLAVEVEQAASKPLMEALKDLHATPGGDELLLRALDAAQWTAAPEKLRALGRTLAACANDSAHIDLGALLVTALHAVDGPHIRLLGTLVQAHTRPENGETTTIWQAEPLVEADDAMSQDTVELLLGVLTAQGLAKVHSLYGSLGWSATDLGRLLVQRAKAGSVQDGTL